MKERFSQSGFTRVELLAVIVVGGLLLSVLVPRLSALEQDVSLAECQNNLGRIGAGMFAYAADHNATLRGVKNHGRWDVGQFRSWDQDPFPWINQDDTFAYWGVAYRSYIDGGHLRFRCPEAGDVDDWYEFNQERYKYSTYGLNSKMGGARLSSVGSPGTTIITQDAAEQNMEGESDSLGKWPGSAINLLQWRRENPGYPLWKTYPCGVREWFRHGNPKGLNSSNVISGSCNTLWFDGHVSPIPYTSSGDYRWYTGQ